MLFETHIEATARPSGKPSQEVYLEGSYLIDKARYIGGVEDTHMLELLRTCEGFRTLVHSIGVSVKAEHNQGDITFLLQNWGKTDKYTSGTALRLPVRQTGPSLFCSWSRLNGRRTMMFPVNLPLSLIRRAGLRWRALFLSE